VDMQVGQGVNRYCRSSKRAIILLCAARERNPLFYLRFLPFSPGVIQVWGNR
jgi:hypothetical protein